MIRVLIADDHTIVRKGIVQILNDTDDMAPVDEAENGREVLRKTSEGSFDVVLLDISMPGMNGLDVLKQLKISSPGINVLILSMYPEEQYAIRLLKAGAAGYVSKDRAPEELIKAIRKVSKGRKYVSPSLAERLAWNLATDSDRPLYEILSDREFQIICEIASGKTVGEIAEKLSLSPKTVSTYRTRVLRKTGMKNNAELMRYAILNNLVE
jgi:DNA-binding NarL/FixJ family response regulator